MEIGFKMAGACLGTNSKYAGGGYGRVYPPPIRKKKNQDLNSMVASPAFSGPKHRLSCFQNKSDKQSKSYRFGSGLLQNRYTSVFKDLTHVMHVFITFFTI